MSAAKKTVLVVGGSGFLGSRIATELASRDVATVVMSRGAGFKHPTASVETRVGDLMKPESLDAALAGVDVVVTSAAGYTKSRKGDTIATDTQGVKNLIDAVKKAPHVKRLVILSILECDKAKDVPHFYAKYEQEEYAQKQGVPWVSVRPPVFIDQTEQWDQLAKSVSTKGVMPSFFSPGVKCAWIYTPDLARYVADAAVKLSDEQALGQRIAVAADPAMSPVDIAKDVLTPLLGRPVVAKSMIPGAVLTIGSWLSSQMYDMKMMIRFVDTGVYVMPDGAYAKMAELFGAPAPTLAASFEAYLVAKGVAVQKPAQ